MQADEQGRIIRTTVPDKAEHCDRASLYNLWDEAIQSSSIPLEFLLYKECYGTPPWKKVKNSERNLEFKRTIDLGLHNHYHMKGFLFNWIT